MLINGDLLEHQQTGCKKDWAKKHLRGGESFILPSLKQVPSLSIGGHPWTHIKYMKWLAGRNRVLLAELKAPVGYVPHLTPEDRKKCREVFEQAGHFFNNIVCFKI